jgi:hypothetical protein
MIIFLFPLGFVVWAILAICGVAVASTIFKQFMVNMNQMAERIGQKAMMWGCIIIGVLVMVGLPIAIVTVETILENTP